MKQQTLFEARLASRSHPSLVTHSSLSPGPAGNPGLQGEPYRWPFLAPGRKGAIGLLDRGLRRSDRRWVIGSGGDPYQDDRVSSRTREVLTSLSREWGKTVWVMTRSSRALKDLDLLCRLTVRHRLRVSMLLATTDRELSRWLEPATEEPKRRLQALSLFSKAGIPTGAVQVPLLPGVNDSLKDLEAIFVALSEAGVAHLQVALLSLRGKPGLERYLAFLEQNCPAALSITRRVYGEPGEPSEDYRRVLATRLRALRQKFGLAVESSPESAGAQLWLPSGRSVAA